jgi:enamine deaminase RidA (YjgF/YER057c/UK114 family)
MRVVQPDGWPSPRGYANGVVVESAGAVHVAGQIGWEPDGTFASDDLAPQFARALDNVIAVVAAAGGSARTIVSMTVYVTDVAAYRAATREIGRAWRERMGDHFPAMALVGVTELVEPRARVEIQAVAELPEEEVS